MSRIPNDCVARVAAAMGTRISPQTLRYVQQQIQNATAGTAQLSPAQAATASAAHFAQQAQLAAVIQRRNAALNAALYLRSYNYLVNTWQGKYHEGLRALLTGSIEGRKGARSSAMREQYLLQHRYVGGLDTELERAGVRKLFASGAADQEVTRALFQLRQAAPNMTGIGREAQTIAGVIRRYQDLARADANAAGAWIGKLDDWIVTQSHDRWDIEKAGFPAWAQYIGQRLDWPRIEAQVGNIPDKAAWLSEIHLNIISGMHDQARAAANTSGFVGPRNSAKAMSQERLLHFRSADDWNEYNQTFGKKNLRGAVLHGLQYSARNTGLMRVLGTNPEAMFNRLVDEFGERVRATGDTQQIKKFQEATDQGGWLRHRVAEVTGAVSAPVHQTAARVGAGVRAVQTIAKLGGATLSSFGDIATYGAELNFQGRTFLSGVGEALEGLTRGRPPAEAREILAEVGVFFDSMIGEMSRAGSFDEMVPGALSRGMQHFFRLNLLDWWTESLRGRSALGMLHSLAGHRATAWADLPGRLRATFGLYDIIETDWNAIRGGTIRAVDGRDYATAQGLPRGVADKLSRYISDRADQAVLKPDADVQAMVLRSQRPGTLTGELARFIGQFKSYGIGFARQAIGREIYGYGPDAFSQGSVQGLAKLIVASTIFGYASMTVKEMIKGKKPREPENAAQAAKLIQAAMLQGGGFGIYGDYLFGQYNRFGSSALESAAGPTLSTANDIVKLFHKAKAGDDFGASALRLGLNNTPFLNLFYARPVLDYAILWEMQEAVNPGAMRRMERRAKDEAGQEYWLSPSEAVQ